MSSQLKNLSEYDFNSVPSAKEMRFGIVVSQWNEKVTQSLLNGAFQTLIKHGALEDNIVVQYVPGTFELTYGTKWLATNYSVDAIIMIGCVIQGETKHFDYICQSVTHGATELNLQFDIPIVFGVLTTNNLEQAMDRAGGKHGNKGDESAITAIKMASLTVKP